LNLQAGGQYIETWVTRKVKAENQESEFEVRVGKGYDGVQLL
jgi:hypothetical protein